MKKYLDIKDIKSEKPFEGYLWMSDSAEPIIINHQILDNNWIKDELPFVVEGYLYDGENSYVIRHTGKGYFIREFAKDEIEACENSEQTFVSNRMKDMKLKFKQLWRAEKDSLCCDMKTLRPWALIFCGFSN